MSVGHNSGEQVLDGTAQGQLSAIVARIERVEDERSELAADLKEIYTEAKGNGFDTKAIRALIRRRKQDAAKLAEQEAILDLYMHALGMI